MYKGILLTHKRTETGVIEQLESSEWKQLTLFKNRIFSEILLLSLFFSNQFPLLAFLLSSFDI